VFVGVFFYGKYINVNKKTKNINMVNGVSNLLFHFTHLGFRNFPIVELPKCFR